MRHDRKSKRSHLAKRVVSKRGQLGRRKAGLSGRKQVKRGRKRGIASKTSLRRPSPATRVTKRPYTTPARRRSPNVPWSGVRIETLKRLWRGGLSSGQIAVELETTRNAVMGKLDRLGMLGIKREPAGRFAPSVPTAIIPLIEPSEVLAVVPEPIQDLDIIVGPPGEYRPSPDEPFMCPAQLEYFRGKLIAWRQDVMREAKETLDHLQSAGTTEMADEVDRANEIVDRERELTARERQLKLVGKIDAALRRIDDGSYGYCLETGEALSLRRLDARPIATLSVEAQERHEKRERVFRDGSVEPTV